MIDPKPTLALGHHYHRAGDFRQAEQVYLELVEAGTADPELYFLLGAVCQVQERQEEAIVWLRRAVARQPEHAGALHNLGVALAQQRQFGEAAALFERAARAQPGWIEPLLDAGSVHQDQGELDEARRCLERALTVANRADVHNQLGSVLALSGEQSEAVAHFSEAVRQEPRFAVAHSNLLMALCHDPEQEPAALAAEHRGWGRLHGAGLSVRPTLANRPEPGWRLRVGYVSPDFRRGPAAAFIEPLFAAHDRAQVEVFAYAELNRADDVTDRLQELVAGWRWTRGGSDAQIADQIRTDGIDILVDLAGHTANHRLGVFALKPAPVQVTYLGYPSTTGLATVDYRLTDAIADPEGERNYHSEELVRLPGCFCCYGPPLDAPEIKPGPLNESGRVTFGSPHKLLKLNDAVFDLWARVLAAVPSSRLLLCRNTLTGPTRDRLLGRLRERGIDPERYELCRAVAEGDGYFGVYQAMDVVLDPLPWTGHATTCEALWMGVPVVTLRGNRFAGRMSASVLTAVGMSELVAKDADEYVAIARRLAEDHAGLGRIRMELRDRVRRSPLCDARGFTRGLEEAYRWMWQRWCERTKDSAAPQGPLA